MSSSRASACRERGQGQGANPITARSVEPAAFFYDGEQHHCAHRVIHDRRNAPQWGHLKVSAI